MLAKSGNSATFDSPPARSVVAYTDGSCPNNRAVSYENPAGWGFALVFDHDTNSHPSPASNWICSWGPVKSNPQSAEGLSIGSKNTGELRAIIELLDYLLYYSGLDRGDSVVVYTDSQYVLSLLLGTSLPCTQPPASIACAAVLYRSSSAI